MLYAFNAAVVGLGVLDSPTTAVARVRAATRRGCAGCSLAFSCAGDVSVFLRVSPGREPPPVQPELWTLAQAWAWLTFASLSTTVLVSWQTHRCVTALGLVRVRQAGTTATLNLCSPLVHRCASLGWLFTCAGIVAGIDPETRTFHVATPLGLPSLARVNVLLRGSQSLPAMFMHQGDVVQDCYVTELCVTGFGTGGARMHSRNTLKRQRLQHG